MVKLRFFVVLFILISSCATTFAGSGNTYDFLRNDVSARAAALGGTFVTMTNDPNLLFYNPAGLATLSEQKLSLGFFKHLMDINSGYVSFGTVLQDFGSVGFGVTYTNYGDFNWTGEEGQNLGTFSANDLAFVAGYGGELQPGLRYGANAKFIYSSIQDYNSFGAALDFGLQYIAVPERVTIGASAMNIGTQLDPYGQTKEDLPLDVKVGVSVMPEHLPATLNLNLHKLNEDQDNFVDRFKQFSIGAEFAASPNVFIRLGYNHERRQELKIGTSTGLAGLSVGAGFTTGAYGIDYSFNSYGPIGGLHRVSVSF